MSRDPQSLEAVKAIVARYSAEPFEWGRTDCAYFARDCVLAISGKNILRIGRFGFDGNYDSRLAVCVRLRQNGFRSVGQALAASMAAHGFEEIPPRFAIEGDVGLTADEIIAVHFGRGFIARVEPGVWRVVKVSRAWRVD